MSTAVYSSDRAQANRSLQANCELVLQNTRYLRRKDRTGRKEAEVRRILSKLEAGHNPVDWERTLVDEACEMVWAAQGYQSIERHTDQRKRSLRFGHQ